MKTCSRQPGPNHRERGALLQRVGTRLPGMRTMLCRAATVVLLLVPALCAAAQQENSGVPSSPLVIADLPVITETRRKLTEDYCHVHYGSDGRELKSPRMIVVHYTAFPTLRDSYEFFKPSLLQSSRTDIRSGGRLNIAAHFLVDRNGAIYRLAPDDVVCRHTIGFNHVALGIENVGKDKRDLMDPQVTADALLISELVKKYPTIEYLIGHYEYMDATLPHFALFRELDAGYRPTVKIDPGPEFMKRLRSVLLDKYGLRLKK